MNRKPEPEYDYDETQIWVFQLGEQFGDIEEMRVRPRGTGVVTAYTPHEDMVEVGFTPEEKAWRLKAACRGLDPGIFYPLKGFSSLPAYSVCIECPVRIPCLESSFGERFGIWAGFTDSERMRIQQTWKKGTNGKSLKDAMEPIDRRKYQKYQRAIRMNSPALQYRGHLNGHADWGLEEEEPEED